VTYLGGSGDDMATAIAVDAAGNAYVTGTTASSDFPITSGAYQTTTGGIVTSFTLGKLGDAFVTKLNPTGTALVYSTYLGGKAEDLGTAIAVDAGGNAYVGGSTRSANFPTKNANQTAYKGSGGNPNLCDSCGPVFNAGDGFVAKLNSFGSDLVWSTYIGGSLDDAVTALALDSSSNVYVGGTTLSTDFPTLNAFQKTYGGGANVNAQPVITTGDGFVAKFDIGGKLQYSSYLGGSGDDAVMALAVDSAGAAYVSGFTSSANLATANLLHGSFKGPSTITGQRGFVWGDAFAAKVGPTGALIYATYLGGSKDDAGMAIAVDVAGDAIIGGFTNSTDMTLSPDALQKTYGGTRPNETDDTGDAFLAKLSPDGATVLYASYYGGSNDEVITGLAVDSSGNVIVVGSTTSSNLTVTANAAQSKFGGENSQIQAEVLGDCFLAIFSGVAANAAPLLTQAINVATSGSSFAPGTEIAVFGSNLPTSASAGAKVGSLSAQVVAVTVSNWVLVIPNTVPIGPSTIQIGTSAPLNINISQYAPGIFSTTNDGTGVVDAFHANNNPVTASNPAVPGESITINATGLGAASAAGALGAPLTVLLAQDSITPAAVTPASNGRYMITFVVPADVGSGVRNIFISIGGVSSEILTMAVGAAPPPVPVITSAQNGASFVDGFAVNAWLTLKGTNLAQVPSDTWANAIVGGQLPTTLDGITVTVGGQPAYIYYVSPGQINVVAPNIGTGSTTVVVKNALGPSVPFTTTAYAAQPAFFPMSGPYIVATHYPDYTLAVKNGTYPGFPTVAAKPGDVLILWGTGFGATTPATPVGVQVPSDGTTYSTSNTVTVTIGGQPATVYGAAMAPGFAALCQVAIQVPSNLADGDYSVVASVAGASSPVTGMLTIQK
jgi:uncharacterized protein (TIGR03437 family)